MKTVKYKGDKVFPVVNTVFFVLLSLTMIYPFWHQICLSLSDNNLAKSGGFFLLPRGFDTAGYQVVFTSRYIWTAFLNSIFITVVTMLLSLLFCSGLAFLISKSHVRFSRSLKLLVLFSFLFNGGMIPTYLVVKSTGIINTLWALIIPVLFAPYNILIIASFFKEMSPSLEESALIDGANYSTVFFRIVLPLSKPVLATVAIWIAVSQWNSYLNGLLYINDRSKYILPLLIRDIVLSASDLANLEAFSMTNTDIINAATIVIATLPILIVYPFMQKYFTKGIMLGAVKG
ncbi:MAG: carbohydrate ABC transporter permease [Eubacteriales bacterium]|nr:carbohydrate ABC transporter permease [Eubacteriales bacterium]